MSAPPTITKPAAPMAWSSNARERESRRPRIRMVAAASGGVSRAQGHQLASWPATIRGKGSGMARSQYSIAKTSAKAVQNPNPARSSRAGATRSRSRAIGRSGSSGWVIARGDVRAPTPGTRTPPEDSAGQGAGRLLPKSATKRHSPVSCFCQMVRYLV